MSKIYSLYQYLKNEDSKIIYLFKSGIFYIAISEDATYLSNKFGFKLTRFNDNIQKCGFPIASVEKYTKLFADNNVNFKLINSTSDNTSSSNKNNDDVKKLIDNISNNSFVFSISKFCASFNSSTALSTLFMPI